MDIYKKAAADMFNVSIDEVTPEQRVEAKIRLGLSMYGPVTLPEHIQNNLIDEFLRNMK